LPSSSSPSLRASAASLGLRGEIVGDLLLRDLAVLGVGLRQLRGGPQDLDPFGHAEV